MKNLRKLLIFIVLFLGVSKFTYADLGFITSKSDVNINTIYKEAILTRAQILKDFSDGESLNKRIEKFFIKLHFDKNRTSKLNTLETRLGRVLKKYDGRSLTIKERKLINLVKNLYYRTIIDIRK